MRYVFIGGEAFPLKPYLIKIYSTNALDILERIFNCRLSRADESFQKQPPERYSIKKVFFKNFAKLTGKHQCQSLFFNSIASLRVQLYEKKDSGTSVFLWIFLWISSKIFKNSYIMKHLWTTTFATEYVLSILATRFRVFWRRLTANAETVVLITKAVVALHRFWCFPETWLETNIVLHLCRFWNKQSSC